MKSILFVCLLLAGALALAACAMPAAAPAEPMAEAVQPMEESAPEAADDTGTSTETSTEAPAESAAEAEAAEAGESDTDEAVSEEAMSEEAASEEAVSAETAANLDLPAWQTLPLTDARNGQAFTLADFAGKTVFVEPMATWCSNCRRQLENVKTAHAQLAGDDVVFIALSVETTIAPDALAAYADDAGFDWTFAVMTPEMLQALAEAFGQTVSNPPATPHFVIRPDGSTTDLVTGIEPSADIIAQIDASRG